ncbi:class I SAM-dependent methyltransferase [Chitinophaga vietnamensis]|uniref:class I SAM-dependent methyltransferase n=1 Tax=Chitinophaga vietnamensis TaxID=2593957 RepID=UPI001177A428|nr:methyltransferase domain-containing protein [Chitinophaga vietnamensis]
MSLIKYLKSYSTSGTFISSSRTAINKLTNDDTFKRAKTIVELGGGTGKVSRRILSKMQPDASLLCFEIQPGFANVLHKINDPRLQIINDSAVHLLRYVEKNSVDLIISTLPLSFIKPEERNHLIMDCHTALKEDGIFRQLSFLYFPQYFNGVFNSVRTEFAVIGIPPAVLYFCLK